MSRYITSLYLERKVVRNLKEKETNISKEVRNFLSKLNQELEKEKIEVK